MRLRTEVDENSWRWIEVDWQLA